MLIFNLFFNCSDYNCFMCIYSKRNDVKEVFLFERLDSGIIRETIKFLKCIVFVRPTAENIKLLSDELNLLNMRNIIYIFKHNLQADLKTLADSDEQETVREVREFYADFIPISPYFVTLDIPNPYTSQRYQKTSSDAQRLAEELIKQQSKDKRRPVSPLLNQWTYEAMVHELIGMHNNRVKLGNDAKMNRRI
ncbi:vacuolar protein sorting-associated protein 45-like protein [Gossypium australe]|uniref:Vacuolar protein sorting-associated protein 45-like protein n=1 Tax=Gossypium australe TaxID=47621 RepID=A0A5B6U444_9ROSI|nr:vacuolar protein sorting-associated protein 45-like protein [Gossypium australe]